VPFSEAIVDAGEYLVCCSGVFALDGRLWSERPPLFSR